MPIPGTIRLVCPRCGRIGVLMLRVKRRNDLIYITVQHNDGGRKVEHSLGPATQLLDNDRFEMLVRKFVEAYETYLRQKLTKVREEVRKLVATTTNS